MATVEPRPFKSGLKDFTAPRLAKILPLLAALAATPTLAREADPHAGHHPGGPPPAAAQPPATAPKAETPPAPATKGCPMMQPGMAGMNGQMMDGPKPAAAPAAPMAMQPGTDGAMMSMDMPCMRKAAAPASSPAPDAKPADPHAH